MTDPRRLAKILQVTSYPPPRAGWGIRVEFLKKQLEREGHSCVVLNIGTSRAIPSTEYETVLGGRDLLRKLWRFCRQGYTVHAHANGDALKGTLLALAAEVVCLLFGRRPLLTFHAGVIQRYFPPQRSRRHMPLYWLLFALPRRIICNSEAVKREILRYGPSASRVVAIPAFSRQYMEYTPASLPANLLTFFERYEHVVFAYVRMRPLFYPVTMVEGIAEVVRRHPNVGLALCGGAAGHQDAGIGDSVDARIHELELADHICMVDDLDHDAFLTAMKRSTLYLRTPITDGVASSVLEALALGVPVVACENGTRPAGVLTYTVDDPRDMADRVCDVIEHREQAVERLQAAELPDTVADEIAVIAGGA